jgi:hypothetical protein
MPERFETQCELKLRPPKEEARNGTGIKAGHYKTASLERTASEGGTYKSKETGRQDGGINPPLQRTAASRNAKGLA